MSGESSPGGFAATSWTLVHRVQSDHQALDEILTRYLPPLRNYLLRTKRLSEDLVDDVLQEFVVSRVLAKDLISKANRERGKFRTFLLSSLNHFLIDYWRHANAAKRAADQAPVALDEGEIGENQARDQFDAEWATEIVRETLHRVWRHFLDQGELSIWYVLLYRELLPAFSAASQISFEDLQSRYQFDTVHQVRNKLTTAKRRCRAVWEEVIGEYATDDDLVAEMGEIQLILASGLSSTESILLDEMLDQPSQPAHGQWATRISGLFEIEPYEAMESSVWSQLGAVLLQPALDLIDEVDPTLSRWESASIGDLFQGEKTNARLLIAIKDYGRAISEGSLSPAPQIGIYLYLRAIGAAWVGCGEWITSATIGQVINGMQTLMTDPEMTDEARRPLEELRAKLLGNR